MMESRKRTAQLKEREQSQDLRDFALDVLQTIGALVDVREAGIVEAILPEGHQELLDDSDNGYLRLAFDHEALAAHRDAHHVALGSHLTDGLIDLAAGMGLVTRYYINDLKWSRRLAVDMNTWKARVTNARLVPEGVDYPFACHYVLLNFKVSYISDEKREELRTVVVDSSSLQSGIRLQQAWSRLQISPKREFVASDVDSLPDASRLDAIYRRAAIILDRQIADSIALYRRRTARHLEIENLRIDTFYEDTEKELRRRRERADSEERALTIQRKIEASDLERQRKRADLAAKHRLRVVFTLLNAAIVTQPKAYSKVKVENRYATADLRVVFDPVSSELELPVCEVCSEATEVFHLCANGHIACPNCILTCIACKREHCRTCGVDYCTVCGQPVCLHSRVRCHVCGKITCPTHRGACHVLA